MKLRRPYKEANKRLGKTMKADNKGGSQRKTRKKVCI